MAFKNISKLIFIQANPEIKKSHLSRCVFSFGIRDTLTMYDLTLKKNVCIRPVMGRSCTQWFRGWGLGQIWFGVQALDAAFLAVCN